MVVDYVQTENQHTRKIPFKLFQKSSQSQNSSQISQIHHVLIIPSQTNFPRHHRHLVDVIHIN